MAKAKLTPEQWAEARREWESNPTASYATVAAKHMISKALVGQRASAEKWQRDVGVPDPKSSEAIAARAVNLQNHRGSGYAGAPVDVQSRPESACAPSPEPVVAEVFAIRPAPAPSSGDISMPDGLDPSEQEALIRAAVIRRQTEMNATHRKELRAVKAQLYKAVNGASEKGGGAAALSVLRAVQALERMQAVELDREIERVKLECAVFAGAPVKPQPVRILVHCIPGLRIAGAGPDEAPDATTKRIYGPNAAAVEKNEVTDV